MIVKERDSRANDIAELNKLLAYNLSEKQRFLIEREIASIKKGEYGEANSAYYIDFYYGDSQNWVVIHDLRLEFHGKVAQIDHILINRFSEIYILESKNYNYGVKITENGEFEVFYNGRYIGIPSPIEQNKRHITLLSKIINEYDLIPRRLSLPIKPTFFNYILISPKAIIKRPNPKKFDTSNVIKADTLHSVINERIDNVSIIDALTAIPKISSLSSVVKFAEKLVSFHKPATVNWAKRFGVDNKVIRKNGYFCSRCKTRISKKVAKFCWSNKSRFKGKAFCYRCQKQI